MGRTMTRHPHQWREFLASHGEVRKDSVPPAIREAANAAWRMEAPWPLVLLGEAGAGKTCAALWMLNFVKTGAWFMTMGGWCHRIAQAQWGTLQSASGYKLSDTEEWSTYSNAYLAVLDDIGAREVSEHHHSTLMQSLEVRLSKRTVLTSNLTMEQLAAVYDDRIVSRLSAGTIVYVTGDKRKPQGKTVGHPVFKDGRDA